MIKPKILTDDDQPKAKPKPKWADPNKDKFRRSKKHENRLADKLGGKRLARSGGMAWSKWDSTTAGADVTTKDFHIEHKRTEKDSMSLKKEWLEKVSAASLRVSKDPAVIVTFEEANRAPKDWVMIPMDVFERMRAAYMGESSEQ